MDEILLDKEVEVTICMLHDARQIPGNVLGFFDASDNAMWNYKEDLSDSIELYDFYIQPRQYVRHKSISIADLDQDHLVSHSAMRRMSAVMGRILAYNELVARKTNEQKYVSPAHGKRS